MVRSMGPKSNSPVETQLFLTRPHCKAVLEMVPKDGFVMSFWCPSTWAKNMFQCYKLVLFWSTVLFSDRIGCSIIFNWHSAVADDCNAYQRNSLSNSTAPFKLLFHLKSENQLLCLASIGKLQYMLYYHHSCDVSSWILFWN